MDKEQILEECRQRCTCGNRPRPSQASTQDNDLYTEEQRTFLSFLTETISVIAFIVFGSVVFWLAVGGILFDFLKRVYYSDKYVKIFIASLFSLLFLSMSVRVYLNKRACRAHYMLIQKEQEKKAAKDDPKRQSESQSATVAGKVTAASTKPPEPPPPPPPEYIKIKLKDAQLQALTEEHERVLTKKFTLTITDEKKKEVFKTTKVFLIPHEAMENNTKPALVVYLKEITLDEY